MKKKSLLSSILSCVLIFAVFTSIVSAEESTEQEPQWSEEIVVATPEGQPHARIEFIDETKLNQTTPFAGDRRVYRSSFSEVAKNTITAYNIGPREKDIFLISVPKGVKKTISDSKSVSASVQYSGSVSATIKSLINIELTGGASGSFSNTWSKTVEYTGPEGNYTTRDYYGAVNYDQYSTVVKTYDVYDEYLGSAYLGRVNDLVSTQTITGTKKPKAVEYYRDFNN
ncbi:MULTISPECIES: hypothetical protein [Paenibacillus]|uniref:Uncharacterized protein n=1 Tax=Paenibacillus lautus TaxID=1401 RepID=A0A1R1AWM7_PAELA|nr:hypothetical protein [Paenibacillus lautus]OME90021.1 hypothetical protein BK123_22195 [Paenibacillus lautus]